MQSKSIQTLNHNSPKEKIITDERVKIKGTRCCVDRKIKDKIREFVKKKAKKTLSWTQKTAKNTSNL